MDVKHVRTVTFPPSTSACAYAVNLLNHEPEARLKPHRLWFSFSPCEHELYICSNFYFTFCQWRHNPRKSLTHFVVPKVGADNITAQDKCSIKYRKNTHNRFFIFIVIFFFSYLNTEGHGFFSDSLSLLPVLLHRPAVQLCSLHTLCRQDCAATEHSDARLFIDVGEKYMHTHWFSIFTQLWKSVEG